MTEILTESFCERCGTRYTFESVSGGRKPLSRIGTLGRGIRHFVSDPGSSLDEAFAVARSEQEQRSTASALEAFHRTFQFCLSCRQYTCADCWNAVEGRCLSCAPTPDAAPPDKRLDTPVSLQPVDLAPPPATVALEPDTPETTLAKAEAALAAEAAAAATAADAAADWARAAAEADAAAEAEAALAAEDAARVAAEADADAAALAAADAEAQAAAAAVEAEAAAAAVEAEAAAVIAAGHEAEARAAADAAAEAEIVAATEAEARASAEAEVAAAAAAEAEVAAAAATSTDGDATDRLLTFEPGLNLDEQIAAYERERVAAQGLTTGTEVAPGAEAPEAETPEADASRAEAPEAAAASETDSDAVANADAGIDIETPVAAESQSKVAAAAAEPIPTAVGQALPASAVDGPLAWPEPGGAGATIDARWPDLGTVHRTGAGLPAGDQVPTPAPARACPSCGLSLSASARFCRRCGTQQQAAGSAR